MQEELRSTMLPTRFIDWKKRPLDEEPGGMPGGRVSEDVKSTEFVTKRQKGADQSETSRKWRKTEIAKFCACGKTGRISR